MTLDEKIGQMTQADESTIFTLDDIQTYSLGSLLSGGGGYPMDGNSAENWAKMVDQFQSYALQTRLGIPLIYGVDAVHGHNNLYGATIFPHNIGLGAANDPDLVKRIGRATAEEVVATGIRWSFSPVVAVVQDIRWGRTYEGFSENPDLVTSLSRAYLLGLQDAGDPAGLANPLAVLATPKHYLGDGGTSWGYSRTADYKLDGGDTRVDEATLRALFLSTYKVMVDSGAESIMVSFSSWNGTKMHANKYLLTDTLKEELGFKGFLISDWQAIDQISWDYYQSVVTSINAGLDMIMVPTYYKNFIATLKLAVNKGDVPLTRIDDAVRRILTVKFNLGLFEHPYSDPQYLPQVGSPEHRQLAREAVRKSLVLLKNDGNLLPISKDTALTYVAGRSADNMGNQCGGWTIEWQGMSGDIEPGTTILKGIQETVSNKAVVEYDRNGKFSGKPTADVGIAVVGELPYAEGVGDKSNLGLDPLDIQIINNLKAVSKKVIVVLVSGRPMVVTEQIQEWDALVAAWLPGTEGQGVADVLFGDYPFTGTLAYTWPRWNNQLPFDFKNLSTEGCSAPLFPFGYGLGKNGSQPITWIDCPKP
jgi:beta-glucosidase